MKVGDRFDTPFEQGCVVTKAPDPNDPRTVRPLRRNSPHREYFLALDSDGVECEFTTDIVIGHPDFRS